MESSDDLYDVIGTVGRRLARKCIRAWRIENDSRCARILGEVSMPTKFYPAGDRVLIKPTPFKETSDSGLIILPSLHKVRATTGTIVALGPDCTTDLNIGDKVLFGKYTGADLELNKEALTICRQPDILGVIEDEGPITEDPSDDHPTS